MIIGAVMVPHPPIAVHEVGRGEEKKVQATLNAYDQAAAIIAELKPDTLIITSPHAVMYRDWFNVSSGSKAYGDLGQFRADGVQFEETYDQEFTEVLDHLLYQNHFPGGTQYDREKMLDHGTMVPLYFIRKRYASYKLVRIGLSGLSLPMHYQLGMYVRQVSDMLKRRVVMVASGDLSHCQKADGPYGYRAEGPLYDAKIMETMGSGHFEELLEYDPSFLEKSMECGHRSFTIMAGALDGLKVEPHVLSHEATFGVGYGVVTYSIDGVDDKRHFLQQYEKKEQDRLAHQGDAYVMLARKSIETWVKEHRIMEAPDHLPDDLMKRRAGAFVSIHEYGQLRGCIGTISAVRSNLAEEIIHNAVSACSRDPRFEAVEEHELPYLEISVDVLGDAEVIHSRSELNVRKYGIIVTKDDRRGLLLPDLDGIDTIEKQYETACHKAGIDPSEKDIEMQRFEVVRHV